MTNEPAQTENTDQRTAERAEGELLLAAAERIVPPSGNRRDTAKRFLAGASASGLDLSHAFAVIDRGSSGRQAWARQACLAIPGPGRTAMLFVSPPSAADETEADRVERDACIRASIASLPPERVAVAQALPDPSDHWTTQAFERAGMLQVGDLAYLSRSMHARASRPGDLPEGIEIRQAGHLAEPCAERTLMLETLEATYTDTLDCPELCGMRRVEDILESHLAAGLYKAQHWLIATEQGRGIGCSLVSETDDGSTAELVYLGLAPGARGRGLGRRLLESSIWGLRLSKAKRLVCAVDRRNSPALRLYDSFGFDEFASRRAWVKPIGSGGG
ncbi:MAG: GNAT family N-acetyltransferase [Planctomycetota bacterium]